MEEYAESARILSQARAPVFIMPGNKDDRKNIKKFCTKEDNLSASTKFIEYKIHNLSVKIIV